MRFPGARNPKRQRGVSLIVSLVFLVAVLILATSAASIALQGEKASRADRDRQIAFQAAEAALADAELDIEGSPDAVRSRSHLFANSSAEGFLSGCGAGIGSLNLGLCLPAPEGLPAIWLSVDFSDDSVRAQTVPFGQYTGMTFPTGKGTLPAKPPRYIIELLPYTKAGAGAGPNDLSYFYRITAAGFGVQPTTTVVLQTFYRKDGA